MLRSIGLLIRTMTFCGIAICAAGPRPSHAQAVETTGSSPIKMYVDCAVTSRGNGSAARPYWRITDALKKARALRRENQGRISIRVAPGICSGNFETQPTGQSTRPPELLPLVLNVPNLTLHGAGVMKYAGGYPVGPRAGTATTLTVDTEHLGDIPTTVIYIGPTTRSPSMRVLSSGAPAATGRTRTLTPLTSPKGFLGILPRRSSPTAHSTGRTAAT